MSEKRPEIANSIKTGSFNTNYHDVGSGSPVIMLHGSGPGVTAWANWNKLFPLLSDRYRILAPDMVGFGYTDRPEGLVLNMNTWVQQTVDFMDALGIHKADLVGNSFGGALAIAMAVRYPDRIGRLVLMGSMGVHFTLTYGLDRVWGYTPSLENMKELLDIFAYNRSIVSDDLAKLRYESSILPGFQESFSSLFPEPRQNGVDAMAGNEGYIRSIKQKTLIVHGREDRVIPIETSLKLIQLIEDAQLHIFGKCGHWTQIERTKEFADLLRNFFTD